MAVLLLAFAWAVASLAEVPDVPGETRLRPDEAILFFPGIAWADANGKWSAEVGGYVFEPEQGGATLACLRRAFRLAGVRISGEGKRVFNERARPFLTDRERGKVVWLEVGDSGEVYEAAKTRGDGCFHEVVPIPAPERGVTKLQVVARLPAKDPRSFEGDVHVMYDGRLTVISDVDDTIKLSCVTNSRAMLEKTFCEPFEPITGMPRLLQRLGGTNDAQVLYLSASPWQLLTPLSAFIQEHGFPEGCFILKNVRLTVAGVLQMLKSPVDYKPELLERILSRLPNSRFVLVGDSSEKDPEIYVGVAVKHPGRVARILIRDPGGATADPERYGTLATALGSGTVLEVFSDPAEVQGTVSATQLK